jgi:hypothetical protein
MKNTFQTIAVLFVMLNLNQNVMAQGAPDLTGRSPNPGLSGGISKGPDLTGKSSNREFLMNDSSKTNPAQRGPDLTGKTTDPDLGKIRTPSAADTNQSSGWRIPAILFSLGAVVGVVAFVMKNNKS